MDPLATACASSSSSRPSPSTTQRGCCRARASSVSARATVRACSDRAVSSQSGPCSAAGMGRSACSAASPRSSRVKGGSVWERRANRTSRRIRRISVRRPDPGGPETATATQGTIPSASRSTMAQSACSSLSRPTRKPANGSPAGCGTDRSNSTEGAPSGRMRRISRNNSRALAGRCSMATAISRPTRASHSAGSPERSEDGAGGGPSIRRRTASIPTPNGGTSVHAAYKVAPKLNRSAAGPRSPTRASGAMKPNVPEAPAAPVAKLPAAPGIGSTRSDSPKSISTGRPS